MLTREGFVAANMSGQSALQRSSWKAEAIRKGNLKISGPIPIMEDTPLNDEEEKEFAETGALQSPSQPPDELEPLESRPQTPPQPEHPPPSIPMERASLMSHPVDEQTQEIIQERQPSRSPPRAQHVPETARESVVEPISYSQNGYRSTPESVSKIAQKKKRKSGLRNVFRKMFGRRSRDEPEQEDVSHRGHSYHHSDPGMLQQSPPREPLPNFSGPRISELPVKDLQPLHPLGQHLPFPMNVNAPQATPPKEYLTFDVERPDIGRRRATLPSVSNAGVQRHSLDEARGRLSAWDERLDDEALPSPGIGVALSSPPQTATSTQAKRRSRSADALRDMAKERASIDRRRSAEIRFWRQSHASGSVYSRPQTAKTVDSIRSVQMQAPAITEPEDGIQAMSATLGHVDEPTPSPSAYDEKQDVEPPVSAFNFGLQNELREADAVSPELAPPSSPPEHTTNRLSIEDRVANLEGTFKSIESSLRRMSSRTNRQTIILSEAPRNLRSRNTSSSTSNTNTNFDKLPDYQSSNDTLKSNPASPTLVKPSAEGSKEQVIEKLYEALKYERTARKALEQQVQGLQHDIADLHALVNKLIASATATSPSYPTPSPDTLIVSTEERIATPRAERKDMYVHGKENVFRTNSNDRYARDEAEWREDMPTPNDGDVWATPKEEGFSGSGFFHEERRYA
ncbi:hypothetical protein IQ06DRAFT_231626 [Phaeosphaeriaceae sp. SRC1lsM3a]|nr:hypothetical protein IQ06DRAFT_231626 [Stagonospora sp. SRC1lsM3a]